MSRKAAQTLAKLAIAARKKRLTEQGRTMAEEMGRMGRLAAAKMTPEQRKNRAQKAAKARHSKNISRRKPLSDNE